VFRSKTSGNRGCVLIGSTHKSNWLRRKHG
jgi:hypothetical protein